MKKTLLVLFLLIVVFASISVFTDPSRGGFHELNRFILEPSGVMERSWSLYTGPQCDPAFRVILDLNGADVEWILRDPEGNIQWMGQAGGSRIHRDTVSLHPVPGEWTFEFRAEGSGVFEFRWRGLSHRLPMAGTG